MYREDSTLGRDALRTIERAIPGCERCPRLRRHLRDARRAHPGYWCRPVPGFGDRRAWLLVVGLAPGMHGANRTGRPFQGDASGEWLYASLERLGVWDGERLRGAYIANAVKCVPPANRPVAAELHACRPWLEQEIDALRHTRLVVALGAVARDAVLRAWDVPTRVRRSPFRHGHIERVPDRPPLLASYHPSRQNTNTGRLTRAMWSALWRRAARHAPEPAR